MPDSEALVPRQFFNAEFVAEALEITKEVIGEDPTVLLSPDIIWPYFVATEGAEHMTVRWYVHDFPKLVPVASEGAPPLEIFNRTQGWVRERSKALARAYGALLKKHGAPDGTCVSVDGFLLPRENSALFEIGKEE